MWNVLTCPDFQEELSVCLYQSRPFSSRESFAFQEFRNWPGGKNKSFSAELRHKRIQAQRCFATLLSKKKKISKI